MKPTPVIQGQKCQTIYEQVGPVEKVFYGVETTICWDESTTLTIQRQVEPHGKHNTKDAVYDALKESSERLATVLCSVPAMSDELARLQEAIGTIMQQIDGLNMMAFDERHGGNTAAALVRIRATLRAIHDKCPKCGKASGRVCQCREW